MAVGLVTRMGRDFPTRTSKESPAGGHQFDGYAAFAGDQPRGDQTHVVAWTDLAHDRGEYRRLAETPILLRDDIHPGHELQPERFPAPDVFEFEALDFRDDLNRSVHLVSIIARSHPSNLAHQHLFDPMPFADARKEVASARFTIFVHST